MDAAEAAKRGSEVDDSPAIVGRPWRPRASRGLVLAGESNTLLLHGSGARYLLGLGFGFVLFTLRSPRNPIAWAIAAIMLYGAKNDFPIPLRGFGWG